LALLAVEVVDRFAQLTGMTVVTGPVNLDPGRKLEEQSLPAHPACAGTLDRDFCQRAWLEKLRVADHRSELHWHRCRHGRFCAFVPVLWRGRMLANCHVVCPVSVGQPAFEQNVKVLAVLVENFIARNADLLARLGARVRRVASEPAVVSTGATTAQPQPDHPQVRRAVEFITSHLTDPDLTVAAIAQDLGLNATYLAHLFREQVGTRMSRYIADRRIQRAKVLLAGSDWQIKRIAYECGYSRSDWFSQVFRTRTGQTPAEYRRQARAGEPAPVD